MKTKNSDYVSYDELKKELNLSKEQWLEIENEAQRIMARMEFREQRRKKNLTQQKLAEMAGVPRSTITRFESGKANPTLDKLSKVASVLGMRLDIKLVPIQ